MANQQISQRGVLSLAAALLFLAAPLRAQFSASELSPPPEMIGKIAPRWNLKVWVNSPAPVETSLLRGKVILLRFINDNPAGASGVRELMRTYQADGLSTVGIYAPSPTPTSVDPETVKDLALALGFNFPIGVDSSWQAVNRYWMTQADVEALGATFLIDRNGVVRYVQPDGRYEKSSKDRGARKAYENLEKVLKALLAEPVPDDMAPTPAAAPAEAPTNPAG
jgi:peroxiredoxin